MTTVQLIDDVACGGRLLGARPAALPIRDRIEAVLEAGECVALDFAGTYVTQSFVDELVGVLVLERGPDILSRITFKNCSTETKAILHFVVSDRIDQRERSSEHTHAH